MTHDTTTTHLLVKVMGAEQRDAVAQERRLRRRPAAVRAAAEQVDGSRARRARTHQRARSGDESFVRAHAHPERVIAENMVVPARAAPCATAARRA